MLPKSFKVGPHLYTVEVVPDMIELQDGVSGQHWRARFLVRVAAGRPQSLQEETLLHEIMHILQSQGYIGNEESLKPDEFIGRMTPWLYMILVENGWLHFGESEPQHD